MAGLAPVCQRTLASDQHAGYPTVKQCRYDLNVHLLAPHLNNLYISKIPSVIRITLAS